MAGTNPRVMDMVRKELERKPSISSEELHQKAKKVDRSVGSLSVRQFHARYPLQVKRMRAIGKRGRKRAAAAPAGKKAAKRGPGRPPKSATRAAAPASGDARGAVRAVLLEFAREVASAEAKADVIGVIGRLDTWVDRVQRAVG